MVVGRRSRIVDAEEIDPRAGRREKGEANAEEIRIGFDMGTTEAGRDAADAGVFGVRPEQSDASRLPGSCAAIFRAILPPAI